MTGQFRSLLAALILVASIAAQDDGTLTIERIIESGEFSTEGFGPVRWLADGSGYTALERAAGGGREIVRYSPDSAQRDVMVPAAALTPEGESGPLGVADYTWSDDGRRLLVFTNTRRVWRYNTRGDYWVLDRKTKKLRRLGTKLDRTQLKFAKFTPDARHVVYVHRNDIYVERVADGAMTRLTADGTDTLINGTFDWVYEEEWGLRDGFRICPDGRRIAFWQIDSSRVRKFTLIDNTSGLYPKLTTYGYPKVGETNPSARVGVVSIEGGPVRWIDLPGDPRQNYVARMEWAASSDEVMIQHVNRLQNRIEVRLADATTGKSRVVYVDQDDAWTEVCDDVKWLDDGRAFTWVSERDGWRHIYVVSRDGRNMKSVTPGDYDVVQILRIDPDGRWIDFIASPDDPTQRYLYRARIDRPGPPTRLTPADAPGTHSYLVAPNGRHAIHTMSSHTTPPRIGLVDLPGHKTLRTFVTNEKLADKVKTIRRGNHDFFRVKIDDGTELDGFMIRPPDFDPKKKYPLLVYVYGEPAGQTVVDRWAGGNYYWHLMLAQRGYVVASIDNRGTPAPRGRAWRKSIYGQIGILASEDQAAALRAMKKKFSFIDGERVGIWGWSGGGSMSLNAIFRHPDLYHTAMAIAFIANQRYYDTIYQERYMGLPSTNPDGFRDGSPITFAKNLKGNLLLVYGTGDDNCHYQNCEALVNELVRHGRQFDMAIYPNRTHSIHEGRGTRRHLFSTLTRYLERNLPAGPRASR